MAQDFMAAFGLGDDDRKIAGVDANGVVTVAIQALCCRIEVSQVALHRARSDAH